MAFQYLSAFMMAIMLSACTDNPSQDGPVYLPDTGNPAMHAVSDAKLHELMDQMNALMFERFMAEPDIDRERRQYARKMADTADKLGSTVDAILSRQAALGLTADEQTAFRALAAKLRDQAGTLKAQAVLNRIDSIGQTMDQITATCSSCHALFRKLAN